MIQMIGAACHEMKSMKPGMPVYPSLSGEFAEPRSV